MLQPGDDAQEHLAAAKLAASKGDFITARHHLNVARQEGLTVDMSQIDQIEHLVHLEREHRLIVTIAVPIVGYAILSVLQPTSWTIPVWIGLAFVLIPVCAGLMIARSLSGLERGPVMVRAFGLCALTMLAYAVINMVVLNNRIANQQTNDVNIVIVAVAFVFALAAGAVGALSAMLGFHKGAPV